MINIVYTGTRSYVPCLFLMRPLEWKKERWEHKMHLLPAAAAAVADIESCLCVARTVVVKNNMN